MKESSVTIARVYLHEAKSHRDELLNYLHDECKVRGVTIFRGIAGFGVSGEYHSATFIDMSLDLPVVIEFFDEHDKVLEIIDRLNDKIKPGHIVFWTAKVNN